MKFWYAFTLMGCMLIGSYSAFADHDHTQYNMINLQASVTKEVDNDTMHARLYVTHEDSVSQEVAQRINEDMQWALTILEEFTQIEAQTLNYSMYPNRKKDGKTKLWIGRQELSLTSKDFVELGKVLSNLQSRLQFSNMGFSISKEKYKKVE